MIFSALVLLVGLLAVNGEEKVSYRGYEVIQAFADKVEDLLFLQDLEEYPRLGVWDFGPGLGKYTSSVHFHVHPELRDVIKDELRQRGIHFEVLNTDLQSDIDAEYEENTRRQSYKMPWFESYHNYNDMLAWLDQMANSPACNGGRCETFDIGLSYEGRPIRVLKMTGAPNGCERKPRVWIDSGIHAREWISHTTNMYLMDRMINEYDTDAHVKRMRDSYDWYFLSTVNPDGYVYSWTNDRMWRKSRRPNPGSTCAGTDVNRNFDHMWNSIGASTNPCSETFAGAGAYSEPEARAVSSYLMQFPTTWELFITLHTYGQLFMAPWGYTKTLPAAYNEMFRVGTAAVNAIRATHNIQYTLGSAANILYESSGTSRDWAHGVPNIPYVYTIELRNTNSFVLPPTQIRPTGEEIWNGLKAAITSIWIQRPPHCAN